MTRFRVMTLMVLAWTALVGYWAYLSIQATDPSQSTRALTDLLAELALVGVIWIAGFAVLATMWFMTRPKRRHSGG